MKIFNIGLPELIFVLIIMLIFLGPNGMQDNVRKLARMIRTIVRSQTWRTFTGVYKEVKEYPAQVMKEVELEELSKELNKDIKEINKSVEAEVKAAEGEVNSALNEQNKELREINSELMRTSAEIKAADLHAEEDVQVEEGSDHE